MELPGTLWRRARVAVRPAVGLLFALALMGEAVSADVRVFSGGAPQAALRELAPDFERATGHRVVFTFDLVTQIQRKLAAGEQADVVMLPAPLLAQTQKTIPLRAEGRMILARVGIGVIVRGGATLPDISTSDGVRKMLLDARAVTWADPGTPTGSHLGAAMAQLGIAEQVQPKLIARAAIQGGADLVARGDADVGLYLVSEVQAANGVTLVGLLPPSLQSFVVYGSAIPAYNAAPEAALAFIKFVSDPATNERWKAAGFELVGGR